MTVLGRYVKLLLSGLQQQQKNILLWFADNSRRFSKRGVMKGDQQPVFLDVAWKSLSSIPSFVQCLVLYLYIVLYKSI